nr:M42 family metallopeptidase [Bacilli bacterium]
MLLKRLTEAVGPSGFEGPIRQLIYEEVKPFAQKIYTDTLGSLFVETNPEAKGPKIMLAAHMDEVSLMVVGVEESGLLRFRPIGGVDLRILVAKMVRVGQKGLIGVIGSKAVHLQKPEERQQPLALDQLFIDIGATSKEDALEHVELGDIAVFATEFATFGERCAKAKSFDDRVGCSVLVETIKKNFDLNLVFAFTVQEEIGLRGATPAAFRVSPDYAIVIEGTVCSDVAGTPEQFHATQVGHGPALSVVDAKTIAHRGFLDHIRQVAKQNDITYQLRRTIGGSNDIGAIHLTKEGIIGAAISVPTRYIHAPSQVISMDDYEGAIALVEAVLRRFEQGGFIG